MCGDAIKDTPTLMGEAKADFVLVDPPYGMFLDTDFSSIKGTMSSIGATHGTKGKKYDKVIGDHDDFDPKLITTIFDNFEFCDEMFIFGGDYFAELIPNKNNGSWCVWDKRKDSQADAIGAEFELIWSKQKHKRRMLRHDWFGFLSSENTQDARNRVHPTQKPITLLVDILKQWGKDKNIVADIYLGSGSTLIACEQTDRTCYGMELDPKYVDVIRKRYAKFIQPDNQLPENWEELTPAI
jgi:DNA modification methylase